MADNFEDVMSKRTDADLIQIISGPPSDYQPAAFEAAKKEFEKRNLSVDQISKAKLIIALDQKERDAKAQLPLDAIWKVLTFIFPGIFQIIFSGTFLADGYDRKAKELGRWTLYGFGFYLGLIVLIMLLVRGL